jgi:hypothetical protein
MNKFLKSTMPIADLHPHPLQSIFFADCSSADDENLSADLLARGQLSPIVVMPKPNAAGLPAGTILDGHRRARLLAGIGKTEVEVVVRDDLKDADAAAVEAEFLKFNFQRRQLHPLDKARVSKRLLEIEKKREPGGLRHSEKVTLRDRIGKVMGMSGRNLERYSHVLETPLTIQNAVRDGRLRLVAGAKIAMLEPQVQTEIARRISRITDAGEIAEIVDGYVAVPDGTRHEKLGDAVAAFCRNLDKSAVDLGDRVQNVSPSLASKYMASLDKGARIIKHLRSCARQLKKEKQSSRTKLKSALYN